MSGFAAEWPRLRWEEQTWRGEPYSTAVVPAIASLTPRPETEAAGIAREAALELARLDGELTRIAHVVTPVSLHCEALASSSLEGPGASVLDALTADLGGQSRPITSEVAANIRAARLSSSHSGRPTTASIQEMHRVLLDRQPHYAPGEYRREPVWIRDPAVSPIDVQMFAPHHSRIPELMDDLTAYCRRSDIAPLTQIATALAQFETIHPFTYGNGRTARTLAQALLRHRAVTRAVMIPVSVGFRADSEGYYRALISYREGDVSPIITQLAIASLRSVTNTRYLAAEIESVREAWCSRTRSRRGSARERLIEFALRQPVFTAAMAARAVNVEITNVYRSLAQLSASGFLSVSELRSDAECWHAPDVLTVMETFLTRLNRRRTTS